MTLPAVFRLQPRENGALTGLRGVGSIWVFLVHLNPALLAQSAADQFLRVGHLAVDGFFVLSGFVIAASYPEFFQRWNRGQYLRFQAVRLGRIYPVHVVMLFVTLAMVIVAGIVGYQIRHAATGDVDYSASAFIANLLLIQAWNNDQLSWTGVSWSLSAEWFAYLTFPIAAYWLFRRLTTKRAKVAFVAVTYGAVMISAGWANQSFPMLMLMRVSAGFAAGVIVWMWLRDHPPTTDRRPEIALIALAAFVAAIVAMSAVGIPVGWWPAPFLVFLVFGLSADTGPIARGLRAAPVIYLGRISLSFYLVHMPVLFFISRFVAPRFEPSFREPVMLVAGTLTAVAVATAMFLVVEEPWRKRSKRLARQPRATVAAPVSHDSSLAPAPKLGARDLIGAKVETEPGS